MKAKAVKILRVSFVQEAPRASRVRKDGKSSKNDNPMVASSSYDLDLETCKLEVETLKAEVEASKEPLYLFVLNWDMI